jgi:hypothetical protein
LKENNLKGFLGEFGGAENTACYQALTDALQYMQDNSDVWYVSKYASMTKLVLTVANLGLVGLSGLLVSIKR